MRRLSINAIIETVNIDRESVRRVLKKNLNVKKMCAKMVAKNLTLGWKLNGREILFRHFKNHYALMILKEVGVFQYVDGF